MPERSSTTPYATMPAKQPPAIRLAKRVRHLRALRRVVKDDEQDAEGDEHLKRGEGGLFQTDGAGIWEDVDERIWSRYLPKAPSIHGDENGARYWVRTSDPLRVREVLYH